MRSARRRAVLRGACAAWIREHFRGLFGLGRVPRPTEIAALEKLSVGRLAADGIRPEAFSPRDEAISAVSRDHRRAGPGIIACAFMAAATGRALAAPNPRPRLPAASHQTKASPSPSAPISVRRKSGTLRGGVSGDESLRPCRGRRASGVGAPACCLSLLPSCKCQPILQLP
jgi:hypothetical protein